VTTEVKYRPDRQMTTFRVGLQSYSKRTNKSNK